MNVPDAKEEQQLLDAVKRAVDLVDDQGMRPDAAVEKVAVEQGFGPGKIRLLSFSYNNGRQTSQFKEADDALSKLASFELSDPQKVIDSIYGTKKPVEKASEDYARPPDWLPKPERVKAASYDLTKLASSPAPYTPDPLEALHKARGRAQGVKQAAEEARRQLSAGESALLSKLAHVVGYFRKSAMDRLPFHVVEAAAKTYYGQPMVPLMDYVYDRAKLREKRSKDIKGNPDGVDLHAEPFTLIRACTKAAADVYEARTTVKKANDEAAKVTEEVFRPFVSAGKQPQDKQAADSAMNIIPDALEKTALGVFGVPAVGAAIGTVLSRGLGQYPKTRQDLVQDAMLELDDPKQQNEIRKIRTQAMLNSMMTDPDDPIHGHDPDKVLDAYNEISQFAPRLSEQPAALRPLLRRKLQGNTEPFEAKEMADMEKTVAQSRTPSSLSTQNKSESPQ